MDIEQILIDAARNAPHPFSCIFNDKVYVSEGGWRHPELVALRDNQGYEGEMHCIVEPCVICFAAIVFPRRVTKVTYYLDDAALYNLGFSSPLPRGVGLAEAFPNPNLKVVYQYSPRVEEFYKEIHNETPCHSDDGNG